MQPEVFFVGSIELSWFLRKQKNSRKGVLCCSFRLSVLPRSPFFVEVGQRDSRKGSAVPLCIALSHTGFRLCPLTDALKGIQASTASTLAIPGQHSLNELDIDLGLMLTGNEGMANWCLHITWSFFK